MTFAIMSVIEILLFNLTLVLIYQPEFILNLFKLHEGERPRYCNVMTMMGLVSLCLLFAWSFYLGATLFAYKQSLM